MGTETDTFDVAWKASMLTVLNDGLSKAKAIGFLLIDGGGVGCRHERKSIVALIKKFSGTPTLCPNAKWFLKYTKWDETAFPLSPIEEPAKPQNLNDCSENTFGEGSARGRQTAEDK